MTRRVALLIALLAVAGLTVFVLTRPRRFDVTLSFTRDDLQRRVATRFPVDQRLLFFTMTYSDPDIKLDEASDRVGIGLDATAKLAGVQLVKGRVEGDWEVRYDPADGALYFDDLRIDRFDVQGLPAATRENVARAATPLLREYLRHVPVYRLKRQDFARGVLKSVTVKQGKLYVVLGSA